MERALIIPAEEAITSSPENIGGKAANLSWLVRNGFRVPDFWVLTTIAWENHLTHHHLSHWLEDQLSKITKDHLQDQLLVTVCARIQERIIETPLAPETEQALAGWRQTAITAPDTFFAVRSSVVGEDSCKDSFAGQMDSFLFRKSHSQIIDAIKACWASAFSERAIAYRLQKDLPLQAIRMGIIVQKMIDGNVSGVIFTANPVDGKRHKALLTATYGLAEGLVSGECNADEFVIDYTTDKISDKKIVHKDLQKVFDREAGYGTCISPVNEAIVNQACLTDTQTLEIARQAKAVAALAGTPQDIEWTVQHGQLYFLQTRPVTNLPPSVDSSGKRTVWDNSNIQESYCGVTTPLTFSFASHAYATVYEQTMRLMGIPENVITAHQDMLQNLLGLIKGRVYYNINNWYRGLLLLPSFRQNKADMERMMGLQDPVDFIEDKSLSFARKLSKLPALLQTYTKLLARFRKLPISVASFNQMFEAEYRKIDRSQLQHLSIGKLIDVSEQLEENLLKRWQTPIINDFYVMMYNGKIRRWLEKTKLPDRSVLQNNLLSGEEGMLSTEPTKQLLKLAKEVRENNSLQALFNQYESKYLLTALQVKYPEFHVKCLQYIELYGDRCMGELKLESVTLRQDPSFMFVVIKNYLTRPDLDAKHLQTEENKLRTAAETLVFEVIRRQLGLLSLKRFKQDLDKFRLGVKNRENMRLARTRMFGLFRDIYLEIGKQMAFYGLLDNSRDIFYLTVEELKQYRDGRCVNALLKPIVAARKTEFAQYAQEDLPHHFETYGTAYYPEIYHYPEKGNSNFVTSLHTREWKGTGCYPGVVETQIKVIFSPQDELSLHNAILCTVRTDPGWTPLFPTCSGIVVERGSTLSHSAVVARELGIPAIVGVKDITKHLQSGDTIRMDGSSGLIKLIVNGNNNT